MGIQSGSSERIESSMACVGIGRGGGRSVLGAFTEQDIVHLCRYWAQNLLLLRQSLCFTLELFGLHVLMKLLFICCCTSPGDVLKTCPMMRNLVELEGILDRANHPRVSVIHSGGWASFRIRRDDCRRRTISSAPVAAALS